MKKRENLTVTEKAMKALQDAVAKIVKYHRRSGKSLTLWCDGKAFLVPPSETRVPGKIQSYYQ